MKNLLLLVCIAIAMLTSCTSATSASGHRNDSKVRFKVQQTSVAINFEKNPFAPMYIIWADSAYKIGEVTNCYLDNVSGYTNVVLLERIK